MYPWAKKKLLKEVSYYITHLRHRDLKENGCNMSKRHEGNVKTVDCREGESVVTSHRTLVVHFFLLCHIFQKGSLACPFLRFRKRANKRAQCYPCLATP